jgi:tetratricopeptide (TPR) repeat protein
VIVFVYAVAKMPASLLASIAFERGQRAEAAGNFQTAATEYAKVVEKFPDSTSAVARLGIAQYRAGNRDAAIQTLGSLSGRQAPKELTNEINAVLAEMQQRRDPLRYNPAPARSNYASSGNFDPSSAAALDSDKASSSPPVKPGTVVAEVGGAKINIPPPRGLFRFDGRSAHVDSVLKTGLAPTNKLLAAFASESDLASTLMDKFPEGGRQLFAQSLIKTGYFTQASWVHLKSSFRDNLQADTGKLNSSEVWSHIQSNIARGASQDLGLEFSGAKLMPLEVFEETEDSLCYALLLKSQVRADDIEEPVTVVQYEAAAMVYVRQRVIYLYACSVFGDKADVDWARTSLERWRNDVVAANQ